MSNSSEFFWKFFSRFRNLKPVCNRGDYKDGSGPCITADLVWNSDGWIGFENIVAHFQFAGGYDGDVNWLCRHVCQQHHRCRFMVTNHGAALVKAFNAHAERVLGDYYYTLIVLQDLLGAKPDAKESYNTNGYTVECRLSKQPSRPTTFVCKSFVFTYDKYECVRDPEGDMRFGLSLPELLVITPMLIASLKEQDHK
jgi:hypothetical protein